MRHEHLIGATKSDAYPNQIISLDCDYVWDKSQSLSRAEAARLVGWVGVWFSGTAGVYSEDKWAEGETKEEFWDALFDRMRRGGTITVFSERASLVWTLLDLWRMVECNEVSLCGADERDIQMVRSNGHSNSRVRAVLENPPFILSIRKKPLAGTVKILDVANYGLIPSADVLIMRRRVQRTASFIRKMVSALQRHRLGSLKDTVGSQAGFSFRRQHLTHLLQVHTNERALSIEDDSYYGGRCEAFRLGRVGGPVYHLDVSAMYPFCAGKDDVPVSLAGAIADLPLGDNPQLGAGCGLIAEVTIETDEPAYPYRDIERGITLWPIGTFPTVLAGPELQDALANDRVVRWHRASWYNMKPALKSYSQCVLDMRREYAGDDDMKAWVKGLGVCLIGKFGQKDRRWIDASSNVFHGPWATWWERREGEEWVRYRAIAGYIQKEQISSWTCDAMPAVAAWVCSSARMRLLNMIRCASWENTFYCDTDALMVNQQGFSLLEEAGWVRDGEPGYLRIKNISDTIEIHGVKAYDEAGRSVRAGQPLSSAGVSAGQCYYWTKRSPASACREGRSPDAVRIAVSHDRTEAYRHGEPCANGSVVPFQLNQG